MNSEDIRISKGNMLKLLVVESKFTILILLASVIVYLLTRSAGILVLDLIVGILFMLLGLMSWTNFFEYKVSQETAQEAQYFHSRTQFYGTPQQSPKSKQPKELENISSSLKNSDEIKMQLSHFILYEREKFLVLKGLLLFVLPFILNFLVNYV